MSKPTNQKKFSVIIEKLNLTEPEEPEAFEEFLEDLDDTVIYNLTTEKISEFENVLKNSNDKKRTVNAYITDDPKNFLFLDKKDWPKYIDLMKDKINKIIDERVESLYENQKEDKIEIVEPEFKTIESYDLFEPYEDKKEKPSRIDKLEGEINEIKSLLKNLNKKETSKEDKTEHENLQNFF